MTGFDETDPSAPQPDDEQPVDPAHDRVTPAVDDAPDPDEPRE